MLAEKDAEIERLKRQERGQTTAAKTAWRSADASRARANAAEAEVARLRETVGRVEALHRPVRLYGPASPEVCATCMDDDANHLPFPCPTRTTLAPRESATEAPRTPDGDGRSQAFRDFEHMLRRHAQIWEQDGGDPCRVRLAREFADAAAAYADGRGSPDGPANAWRREQRKTTSTSTTTTTTKEIR